jgi:hypothetical protein
VLFQADWTRGLTGWDGSTDWRVVDGILTNDGSSLRSIIRAPWTPSPTQDYAVEAEIRAIACSRTGPGTGFGVMYAETPRGPWFINLCSDEPSDPSRQGEWIMHRTVIRGNLISQFLNGQQRPIVTGVNAALETPHSERSVFQAVGLFSDRERVEVRSFRVLALTGTQPAAARAAS